MNDQRRQLNSVPCLGELLKEYIHHFIGLKRHHSLVTKIIEECVGKSITNDLIYEHLVFASLDGLFVRLVNFTQGIYDLVDYIKADNSLLIQLKYNNWKGFKANEPQGVFHGEGWTDQSKWDAEKERVSDHKESFTATYEILFPGTRDRRGKPNHTDLDNLKVRLEAVLSPIVAHRDTVVAHWDDEPIAATFVDLKRAFEFLEDTLGALYLVCTLDSYTFEFGGIAASIEDTAQELVPLIISSEIDEANSDI